MESSLLSHEWTALGFLIEQETSLQYSSFASLCTHWLAIIVLSLFVLSETFETSGRAWFSVPILLLLRRSCQVFACILDYFPSCCTSFIFFTGTEFSNGDSSIPVVSCRIFRGLSDVLFQPGRKLRSQSLISVGAFSPVSCCVCHAHHPSERIVVCLERKLRSFKIWSQ